MCCILICRTAVTLIKYTLSVLNADSSVAALSRPSGSVMKEAMKFSQIKYCDCKAYKVRMLWTKDMKEFNSTVIQGSVSSAWVGANDGIHCKLLQIFFCCLYFLFLTLYIHFLLIRFRFNHSNVRHQLWGRIRCRIWVSK